MEEKKIYIYTNSYGTIIHDKNKNTLLGFGNTHIEQIQNKLNIINIKKIECGKNHFLFLLENNILNIVGYYSYIMNGDNIKEHIKTPKKITYFSDLKDINFGILQKNIKNIYCSSTTSYVLLEDFSLYGFGEDIGHNNLNIIPILITLPNNEKIKQIYSSSLVPKIIIATENNKFYFFYKNKFEIIKKDINSSSIKSLHLITAYHFITIKDEFNELIHYYDDEYYYWRKIMEGHSPWGLYDHAPNRKNLGGYVKKIINNNGVEHEKTFYLTTKGLYMARTLNNKLNIEERNKLKNFFINNIDDNLIYFDYFDDKKIIDFVASDNHILVLTKNGEVYGWGTIKFLKVNETDIKKMSKPFLIYK